MKLILVLLIALITHQPHLADGIGTDMGDCACLCGLETNGGVVGEDGTTDSVCLLLICLT